MPNVLAGKSVEDVQKMTPEEALKAVMDTSVEDLKTLSPEIVAAVVTTDPKLFNEKLDEERKGALRYAISGKVAEDLTADPLAQAPAVYDDQAPIIDPATGLPVERPEDSTEVHGNAVQVATRLISTYRRQGVQAFLGDLNQMKSANPDWAETVYYTVMERVSREDVQFSSKFMSDLIAANTDKMKADFDRSMQQALEAERNPTNKKVIELMIYLSSLGYDDKFNPAKKETGTSSNEIAKVVEKILAIDPAQIDNQKYKEFYEVLRKSFDANIRVSMSQDIIRTSTKILETSLLDRTKEDVTFANSLEELRAMSKSDLTDALANNGWTNVFDSDAEVYLASQHVLEAMRLYITYLYPQKVAKGENIPNPITWAFEEVKKGTKIELGDDFEASDEHYMYDIYTNKNTPLAKGSIDPTSMFVAKDEEIRLFDEYQKGEEKIGEMSIWNLVPKTFKEALTPSSLINPVAWPSVMSGGLICGQMGINLHKDYESFLARGDKTSGELIGMMEASKDLLDKDFDQLMAREGGLGSYERLEIAKIQYLRMSRNYDEARAICLKILANVIPQPTDQELQEKMFELDKDYGKKIRAQVRMMIEQDPRLKGKSAADLSMIINKVTADAVQNKAYLDLMAEKTENMTGDNLGEYEKQILEIFKNMNGAGWAVADESLDTVVSVAKFVVETVILVVATWGVGAVIGGVAKGAQVGVQAGSAAAKAGQAGAAGVKLAQSVDAAATATKVAQGVDTAAKVGRLARFGERLGRSSGVARSVFGSKPVQWAATGAGRGARFTRLALKSSAFAEGQELMHGRSLQFIDNPKQAAFEIGTTMMALWALGGTQKFLRGGWAKPAAAAEKAGAQATGEAVAAAEKAGAQATGETVAGVEKAAAEKAGAQATGETVAGVEKAAAGETVASATEQAGTKAAGTEVAKKSFGQRFYHNIRHPVQGLKDSASGISGLTGKLDKLGRARAIVDIPAEMWVMTKVADAQQWLAQRAGILSQDQVDAQDQEQWKEYAQALGMVLGFRRWGALPS